MLQVENMTGFVPGLFVFPDADGIDTAYFVLKATFEVGPDGVRVAAKQAPLVLAEEYWGEPGASSLKRASEAHLCKPSTDIVVIGHAYAPRGRPSPSFDASVSVGRVIKRLRLFGDRTWTRTRDGKGVAPSATQPVERVPLVYEKAFGGVHRVDESTTVYEARNPVGVGFTGKRAPKDLVGLPLPNIEDASELLEKPGQTPRPAGFGFVAANWQPRLSYAGTYGAQWQKKRAPYLPKDFSPRYFQVAHEDLVTPSHLKGGEPVELLNVSPVGLVRFALPVVEFDVEARLADVAHRVEMRMETVVFEPDEGRFSLLWRGAQPCDKQALRLESVRLELKRLEGVVP
jgi:hypothetical protein